jgi:23S rRNA (uracil1939-C5)-methyltransferase
MDEAWRRTGGRLKAIATQRRDLMRSPLDAAELETFDGVVFDPPRAGAEAQSRELAKSRVRRIVAISCNPVTLARDLRILADGGYRVAAITPFDQFAFSPHLEAAATLMR